MKLYSTDFCLKIIQIKRKTNGSIQQIADRIQVSYSFMRKLLKRYEAKGNVESAPHGGGKRPQLNLDQLEMVVELVEEDNDATLQQLCARLEEKTGRERNKST